MNRISRSKPTLQFAGQSIGGHDSVYGLALLMQLSATQVLAQVNLRPVGVPVLDYEDGIDFFIFDSVEGLSHATPQPGFRNHFGPHPETGDPLIWVKYPSGGGFVPLGARRADGSPHPHAGTGFALSKVLGFHAPHSDRPPAKNAVAHSRWELVQLRFDGERLTVEQREAYEDSDLLHGGTYLRRQPMSCSIADGDDLLLPMSGGGSDLNYGVGITRWRCDDRGWRAVTFQPVAPSDLSIEPSLSRDADGSLLLALRGSGPTKWNTTRWPADQPDTREAIRLYQSTDTVNWRQTMCLPHQRAASPVVLNTTADGHPCIVGNPLRHTFINRAGHTCKSAWMREDLYIWALNDSRSGVDTPTCLLDARHDFGEARRDLYHVNFWYIDHPIGGVFRLADGRWHSLIGFRVCELAEVFSDAEPTPFTGYWLDELTSNDDHELTGPWRF